MEQNGTIFHLLSKDRGSLSKGGVSAESEAFTISGNIFGFPNSLSEEGSRRRRTDGGRYSIKDGHQLPPFLKRTFDYDKFACKPLEEIDPHFYRKQTFLVIGTEGQIYRFSGRQSIFIFNPWSGVRETAIYFLCNWHLPLLIAITLTIFIAFSFLLPNYWEIDNSDNPLAIVNVSRYFLCLILLVEIIVKVVARGFVVAEFTYLRSPWDWFDVILITLILLNFYWRNVILHSFQGIAFLKFIPLVPALKNGFRVWIKIVKNLVPVFIYSLLIFWTLLLLAFQNENHLKGVHLPEYSTQLPPPTNCQTSDGDTSTEEKGSTGYLLAQGNYYSNLPSPLHLNISSSMSDSQSLQNASEQFTSSSDNECVESNLQIASLTNITLQILASITLNTFGGFVTHINPLQELLLFVILMLTFGTFLMTLLTVGTVGRLCLILFPVHDQKRKIGFVEKLLDYLPDFQKIFQHWDLSAFEQISKVLAHPILELLITFVICVDIILLSSDVLQNKWDQLTRFHYIIVQGQQVCQILYVIEFTLKLIVHPFNYFRNGWSWLDLLVVLIYLADKFIYPLKSVKLVRILKIIPRWPTLHFITGIPISILKKQYQLILVVLLAISSFEVTTHLMLNKHVSEVGGGSFGSSWKSEFLFLFKDWGLWFENCQSENSSILCISLISVEVIAAFTVVLVTLVAVMCSASHSSEKPFHSSHSYQKLAKAVSVLKDTVNRQSSCCCSWNCLNWLRGTSSNAQSQTLHLENLTLNGGPRGLTLPIQGHENRLVEVDDDRERTKTATYKHPILNYISIAVIFIATLALLLQLDENEGREWTISNTRFIIDLLFCGYFCIILCWTLIGSNLCSLKNPSWLLDFLIISASGLMMYVSTVSSTSTKIERRAPPAIKLITTVASCRGLMLISRLQSLKVAVVGITSEFRLIWRLFVACCFLWLSFLLLKVSIKEGNKERESIRLLAHNYNISNNSASVLENQHIIQKSVENTTRSSQMSILSILIVLTVGGVILGVTFFYFIKHKLVYLFMTSAQLLTYKDKEERRHPQNTFYIPPPKSGLCIQIIHFVMQTSAFELTLIGTILSDCLVITFGHLTTSKNWSIVWRHYKPFILLTYLSELVFKLIGWRMYFFKSFWNIFDSLIVIIGIIDLFVVKVQLGFITADTIRFLRLFRFFQFELYTKHAKLLEIFYTAFKNVAPCILNLLILFITLLYTYTAVGVINVIPTTDDSSKDTLKLFKNIAFFLLVRPFYGNYVSNNLPEIINLPNAQGASCWGSVTTGVYQYLLLFYIYSYLLFSYLIVGNILLIILYEMLKEARRIDYLYATTSSINFTNDNGIECREDINGILVDEETYTLDHPQTLDTILTPMTDDALSTAAVSANYSGLTSSAPGISDDDKYPCRMSANGYIYHVEAIVTTV